MRSERWRQIEDIYNAAQQVEPERRAAFLDNACVSDPDLKREVQSLLSQSRFLYDASYYAQTSHLTAQPVLLPIPRTDSRSGYTRNAYRDFTTNLGGPARHDRLWFFAGYQYLRDYDSQPGTDPNYPRTYEQDKIFAKLTWQLKPGLQLMQSFNDEFWVSPQTPTRVTPFAATARVHATVPTVTFGHLTHTLSSNTFWDVRLGRFVYLRDDDPSTGDPTVPSRFDRVTGVTGGNPPLIGHLTLIRTTAKATLSHYQRGLFAADHEWKIGTQVEKGEHQQPQVIPGGVRYVDNDGQPFQAISAPASNSGGQFITIAHMFRVMGTFDLAGFGVGANLQYFSGKPWAATAQVALPQGDQRILLEPRGSRRLSSQLLLDLRMSKKISARRTGQIELLADVLNVLNDTAEESLATVNLFSPNFVQPTTFIDPRRAMLGMRLNLGR